ncbi:hypothetical protein MRB53_041991 [Persea americana]|nr:hypothetical protein MRB53_041991 [Persea americana]
MRSTSKMSLASHTGSDMPPLPPVTFPGRPACRSLNHHVRARLDSAWRSARVARGVRSRPGGTGWTGKFCLIAINLEISVAGLGGMGFWVGENGVLDLDGGIAWIGG